MVDKGTPRAADNDNMEVHMDGFFSPHRVCSVSGVRQ